MVTRPGGLLEVLQLLFLWFLGRSGLLQSLVDYVPKLTMNLSRFQPIAPFTELEAAAIPPLGRAQVAQGGEARVCLAQV